MFLLFWGSVMCDVIGVFRGFRFHLTRQWVQVAHWQRLSTKPVRVLIDPRVRAVGHGGGERSRREAGDKSDEVVPAFYDERKETAVT